MKTSFFKEWQNIDYKKQYSPEQQAFIRKAIIFALEYVPRPHATKLIEWKKKQGKYNDEITVLLSIAADKEHYLNTGDEQTRAFEHTVLSIIQENNPQWECKTTTELFTFVLTRLTEVLENSRQKSADFLSSDQANEHLTMLLKEEGKTTEEIEEELEYAVEIEEKLILNLLTQYQNFFREAQRLFKLTAEELLIKKPMIQPKERKITLH